MFHSNYNVLVVILLFVLALFMRLFRKYYNIYRMSKLLSFGEVALDWRLLFSNSYSDILCSLDYNYFNITLNRLGVITCGGGG